MMWLLACTAGVDDTGTSLWGPGENEDELGHKRPLLASCFVASDSERSGPTETTYDARGYVTVTGYMGYLQWEETVQVIHIDELLRPVSLEQATTSATLNWTYEGDTWRYLVTPEGTWEWTDDGTATRTYEAGSGSCTETRILGDGLRIASQRMSCTSGDSGDLFDEYTWAEDRLVRMDRSLGGELRKTYEYAYDADGRRIEQEYENDVGYVDLRTYTWDCP